MEGSKIMATNDPAQDAYNPPGNLSHDFERYKFGELELDELFWQTNKPGDGFSWRKISQTQALNIRKQTTHNFNTRTVVYQKV